jgi:hypothetical protein
MIHDFVTLNALRNTKGAEDAVAQAVTYLSKALRTSPYPTGRFQANGITASPLHAGVEQPAGLSPEFLLSGEADVVDNER